MAVRVATILTYLMIAFLLILTVLKSLSVSGQLLWLEHKHKNGLNCSPGEVEQQEVVEELKARD